MQNPLTAKLKEQQDSSVGHITVCLEEGYMNTVWCKMGLSGKSTG